MSNFSPNKSRDSQHTVFKEISKVFDHFIRKEENLLYKQRASSQLVHTKLAMFIVTVFATKPSEVLNSIGPV